jgi:DNA-binding MurR/RpiR family transcriptional regulator
MSAGPSIAHRLKEALPGLGPHAAAAARHVLAHPEDVAVSSMRALAGRIKVPPVTLVRLAQRIGLPGYDALRQSYVDAVRAGARANEAQAERIVSLARRRGALGFAATFLESEHEILRRTAAGLTEERLSAAAADIASARRVFAIGWRTYHPVALAVAYALRKAKPATFVIDASGHAAGADLGEAGRGDAVIAFSTAPYSRVTHAAARLAAADGAAVVAVTDNHNAPLAEIARHVFLTDMRSHAFPESVTGALALGNLLVALVVARLGPPALARIRDNERRIFRTGEYLQGARTRPRRSAP